MAYERPPRISRYRHEVGTPMTHSSAIAFVLLEKVNGRIVASDLDDPRRQVVGETGEMPGVVLAAFQRRYLPPEARIIFDTNPARLRTERDAHLAGGRT